MTLALTLALALALTLTLTDQMHIHPGERLFPRQNPFDVLHRETFKGDRRFQRRAAGMTGHGDGPRCRQSGAHVRFVGVHVHAGGGQVAGFDGVGEGVFVDETAAGDVHETGSAFELGEGRFRDERFPGEGGGDQDAVGDGEQVAQLVVEVGFDFAFLGPRFADDVVVGDAHAEGQVGFLRDRVSDVAEADDPQRESSRVVGPRGGVEMGVLEFAWIT